MAIMPRIRKLLSRSSSASTVGMRRESPHTHNADVVQEDALRAQLADDPNNQLAFNALLELVVRNCADEGSENEDPLNALQDEANYAEKRTMSAWALAEEFSGHPRAWFPLTELARLSIDVDPDEAIRRLTAAIARDPHGEALAVAVKLLAENDRSHEAYNIAMGHWKSREHIPAAGVAVVRAALLSEKQTEAEAALTELLGHASAAEISEIDPELIDEVRGVHRS